jgi:hypothetical protein
MPDMTFSSSVLSSTSLLGRMSQLIVRAFSWWRAEMTGLLPESWRPQPPLQAIWRNGTLVFESAQAETEHTRLSTSHANIQLEDNVHVLPLVLPRGADRALVQAVQYQLLDVAPIAPEKAVYDVQIIGRDRATGTLDVRVALVRLETLAAINDQLRAVGIERASITAVHEGQTFTLQKPANALVGSSDARRLALWATCLIGLLLAAPALIRWTTEKQTARLDAEITNLTAQLRLAEPAHKRAVILSKTDSALRAELLRPRLSQQLEQLAVTLDEKIWLREFAQTADMKRLSLHAKEADTVLAALSVQTVKPWRRIEHAAPGSLPDKDQQGRSLLVLQQEQVP